MFYFTCDRSLNATYPEINHGVALRSLVSVMSGAGRLNFTDSHHLDSTCGVGLYVFSLVGPRRSVNYFNSAV